MAHVPLLSRCLTTPAVTGIDNGVEPRPGRKGGYNLRMDDIVRDHAGPAMILCGTRQASNQSLIVSKDSSDGKRREIITPGGGTREEEILRRIA